MKSHNCNYTNAYNRVLSIEMHYCWFLKKYAVQNKRISPRENFKFSKCASVLTMSPKY